MSPVITFFEAKDWEKEEYLRKLKKSLGEKLQDFKVRFVPYTLNKESSKEHIDTEIAVIYLNSVVDEEVLEQMKNLKFVITRTTGMDHIDILACKKRGIEVANVPGYASVTVAEHAIALMFALARRLRTAFDKMKDFDFSREGLMGFDLFGKVAGVIGTGNIGSHICRIAFGIGMEVIAYDLYPNKEMEELYKVKYVSLEDLLTSADVIFVAVPLTKETRHLINLENIKLVKDGAMLVNIARGPVVDTSALIWALGNGKLKGGVALDVFEGEKVLTEASFLKEICPPEVLTKALQTLYLFRYPNFILTPHVAYYSEEAIGRLVDSVVTEISHYLLYKLSTKTYGEYF